jgi:hypothetical protein
MSMVLDSFSTPITLEWISTTPLIRKLEN